MPTFSRALALVMALLMAMPSGDAFALGHKKNKQQKIAADASPLSQDQRVLHALNRLTFGPRPGDVQTVDKMGLQQWIDLQLNPLKIDDSALEARLSAYPAMRLSLHEMVDRFPSPAMIRAAERGRLALPGNPVERAIYRDQIAQLRERQAKQAEQGKQPSTAVARQGNPPVPAGGAEPIQTAQNTMSSAEPAGSMEPGATAGNDMEAAPASGMQAAAEDPAPYADATRILNLPPDQRVNALVGMQPAQFRSFLQGLKRPERIALFADLTPVQKETVFALINPQLVVGGEVLITRLLRDIYSERQLEAVMTDFWLNHFNVYLRKGPFGPWYLAQYQDQVIRPRALGKFEDLLDATAESPAMLFYLDQTESVGPHSFAAWRNSMTPNGKTHPLGINENYARELMELHTLGVDGGYTQQDVIEVAKAFTGWDIERPDQGGEFVFNPRRHEPGPKVVLGHTIAPNGENEGLEILHMLAVSPVTAHHVSFQIAQRFVSDNPPTALVNAMAATWVKTGGDIREVLRTMLASPEFWSQSAYRAKVKTPEEYVISAVRATGGEVVHPAALVESIAQLGMPLFGCQTPNGYPWTADAWLNSGELLDRMNFSLALADNNAGTTMRWDELMNLQSPDVTADAKEARLESLLLDGTVSAQTHNAALNELAQQSTAPADASSRPQRPRPVNLVRAREFGQLLQAAPPLPPPADQQAALLAGLLLGSPEFQRR